MKARFSTSCLTVDDEAGNFAQIDAAVLPRRPFVRKQPRADE